MTDQKFKLGVLLMLIIWALGFLMLSVDPPEPPAIPVVHLVSGFSIERYRGYGD